MAEKLGRWEAIRKNKEKWKQKAEENDAFVAKKYKNEIDATVKGSVVYGFPDLEPKEISGGTVPLVIVKKLDSVSAVLEYATPDNKTAVLNFADYLIPGGWYLRGSHAQEESLCHESFLHSVLCQFPEYYAYNKKNRNDNLYLDRAIYSPDVVFFRDGDETKCDVVTCASPHYKKATERKVPGEMISDALRKRIHFIHKIAAEQQVDTLILGAFGCGAFKQNAKEVSAMFREEFKKTTIKQIIYAIPARRNRANYDAFVELFGD